MQTRKAVEVHGNTVILNGPRFVMKSAGASLEEIMKANDPMKTERERAIELYREAVNGSVDLGRQGGIHGMGRKFGVEIVLGSGRKVHI